MNAFDVVKAAVIVFVVAILQVTIFNSMDVLGGTPSLLLVTLLCVALLRGSIYGAACGFVAFGTALHERRFPAADVRPTDDPRLLH